MKKIAIQIDENNRLLLLQYTNVDETQKEFFLRGVESYNYLKKLGQSQIIDVYKHQNGKDITLEYNKYIIELHDYMNLLCKKGMGPILNNIRAYNEKIELQNRKRKKVVRKNKYTKARLVATGLSLLIISGCVIGLFNKSEKMIEIGANNVIVDELEEDFMLSFNIKAEDPIVLPISKVEKKSVPTVSINYEDRSTTSKANTTKAYYSELINKYSKIYGLDPKLVTAIATQERGIHSGVKDVGGATGLMQVQNAVWRGQKLSAYNFETKSMETIVVNENALSDVFYNVKVGCMILQTVFKYMNYNTLAAVQCYNMGHGHMDIILNAYSAESGKSKEEILNDVTDTKWMDYRTLVKLGDQEYIEEVFSWLGNDVELTTKKDDGTEVNFNINALNQGKSIH